MAEYRVNRAAGKRARAVSIIKDMPAAQESSSIDVVEIISPAVNVDNAVQNDNIVDLYSVGHKELTRTMCNEGAEVPFQHTLHLLGPKGEVVRVSALFDGCAMISVMCATVFEKVSHRLGEWKKSTRQLRMGNGVIVPSLAVWKGKMRISGVTVDGEFEVFNSGGSWAFLLGKPTLRTFRAEQAYEPDTVDIWSKDNKKITLHNEIKKPRAGESAGVNLTLDVKQRDITIGGSSNVKPPPREVPHDILEDVTQTRTDIPTFPVLATTPEASSNNPESLFTRESDPYKPEQVMKIIQEVTIGSDITHDQSLTVQELIKEYADCFALSIKEVNTIPNAVHKLNILEGMTFRTKIPPRSYNPDQRAFVDAKVDEMLEAGIIRPIHPSEVRFVAQTVLARKAHDGQGLSIDELKYKVNKQCLTNGLPSEFNLPPQPEPNPNHQTTQNTPIKWRMCQDFGGINKVTEIAPIPQGDIRAKQL